MKCSAGESCFVRCFSIPCVMISFLLFWTIDTFNQLAAVECMQVLLLLFKSDVTMSRLMCSNCSVY